MGNIGMCFIAGLLISTVAYASSSEQSVTCYDSTNKSELHVEFNTEHPDFIFIDDFKYVFVGDSTKGDYNVVQYQNFLGTMNFIFKIDGSNVHSMSVAVDGRAPGKTFFSGECK